MTGVTEWNARHGTWEAEKSELCRIDPETGELLNQLDLPAGIAVSALESNGSAFFCAGGNNSGKLSRPQAARNSAANLQ